MEIVDMAWTLFSGIIGVVTGAWIAKKWLFSMESIAETADSVLEYVLKTKEGQEKVYQVGFLLGKAIMDGTGFKGKAGKGGIMQVIEGGLAQWISGALGGEKQETPSHRSSNSGMDIK